MWEVTDSDGRLVVLAMNVWLHILEIHAELNIEPEVVLRIVREPERRIEGRQGGEEWLCGSGAGPTTWIKVVVHYEHGRGRVATAFPRRSFP